MSLFFKLLHYNHGIEILTEEQEKVLQKSVATVFDVSLKDNFCG